MAYCLIMLTSLLSAEFTLFRISLERWQWLALILLGVAAAVLPPLLLVAAIGALAVGIAVISEPLLGLALAMFLGPVGGWEGVFIGGPIAAITTGQLMLFLTIAAWLGRGLLRGHIPIAKTSINAPVIAFIAMGAVTIWNSRSLSDSVTELIKWVEVLFIVWILLDLTRRWPRKKVIFGLVTLLLSAGTVQAIWGIFQFIIRGTGPGHFIIGGRLYRGTGSFMQPNPYGGYMALAASIALGTLAGVLIERWLALPEDQRKPQQVLEIIRRTPWIAGLITLSGLLIFGLIGSWSRGAWFNFLSALVVFAFYLPRSRERGFAITLGGGGILLLIWNIGLIPTALKQRLVGFLATFTTVDVYAIALTPQNYAVVERLAHWQAALNMAAENLWFGVGIGNYAAAYPEYMVPGWPEPLGHAHNIYLNVLAETGIWGLVSYAILWLPILYSAIVVARKLDWPLRGIAIGLLAGWIGFSVHHLLDNLYVNNNIFYLGVMFTVLIMLESEAESRSSTQSNMSAVSSGLSEVSGEVLF